MKNLILLLMLVVVSSCATPRNKNTDKGMRIALIDKGITQSEHMGIQTALMDSGKFYIVDRSTAFKSVVSEQDTENSDRFENSQKYAQIGKLYGVGSVVVAHSQCNGLESSKNVIYLAVHLATLGMFDKTLCTQFLELVDTSTSEVIVSISHEASKAYGSALNWEDIVQKLVDAYPSHFRSITKHSNLIKYESEAKANAVRQKVVLQPVQESYDFSQDAVE